MLDSADELRIKINLDIKNLEKLEQRIKVNKRDLLRLVTECPICGCDLSRVRDKK